MSTISEIYQMRSMGKSDDEIIEEFQERGLSPQEIDDALNQANIKSAVAGIQGESQNYDNYDEEYGVPKINEIGGQYSPSSQEVEEMPQEQQNAQYPQQNEYYSPQESYGYENQPSYEQSYSQSDFSSSSLIDLTSQIVDDKLLAFSDRISELSEFKNLFQAQIENLEMRLRKIEEMIDKLQISIIEKVGSYGDNLNTIKKEMEMMQDSFSKVINPLTERSSNAGGFPPLHSSSSISKQRRK